MRAEDATPGAATDATCGKDVFAVRDLTRATAVAYIEKLTAGRRVHWNPEAE